MKFATNITYTVFYEVGPTQHLLCAESNCGHNWASWLGWGWLRMAKWEKVLREGLQLPGGQPDS